MAKLSELPDAILEKIAEKARAEIVARGRRCAPPPCDGRNAAERLDHSRAISKQISRWAQGYGWSDDFCLMIDVAHSRIDRLVFNITRAISVKVAGPLFILNSGDVFTVDGHGNGSVGPLPTEVVRFHSIATAGDVGAIAKNVEFRSRVRLEGTFDPLQDVRHRHPFAQESDLGAILKWEAALPKPDPLGDALSVPCAAPEAKPALLNAMVVRGGHDSAGWAK